MRLSLADPVHRQGFIPCFGSRLRRNRASRHREDGYAVGDPRLVNSSKKGEYPEKEL